MNSRTTLVEVTRAKQANAERVAHQPFPIGRDTRPLHVEQAQALLMTGCEWTSSPPSFLFRHTALQDGGACYTQLKENAEREFFSANPEEPAFPTFRFADFLEAAYRSGLLTKNFTSPNGDIYSPDRVVMYEIAPSAHALLAQHIPAEIEARIEATPSISEIDNSRVREQLTPVVEYLREHGPSVRDTMLDALTRSSSDDEVQAEWDRLEDTIDEGIKVGILSQEENSLGAFLLTIVP